MYALPYVVFMRIHQWAIDARRRSRTSSYLGWSVVAGLFAGAMVALGVSFVTLLWYANMWWMALPFGAFMIAPVVAPVLTRHVFVRLGWVRVAYYGGAWSRPGDDAAAYGLCCAAWAFAHAPRPAAEAWITAKREARIPLGDAEVAVTGLLAAGRGDADTARLLLRSVAFLVENHPAVRDLVGEWLAVDAAERGAWDELHDDARHARWPATPLVFFLEGVAARRLGAAGEPTRLELQARWLLAPYRRATRALLELAPAADRGTGPARVAELAHADGTLPRAVAAHLAFGTHAAQSAGSLAETVRAWDAALADATTHAWLARRALELDAPLGAVDRALRDVTTAVAEELARVAEAARLGAPTSHGPVGEALGRRLRHGRLDALDQAFTAWAARRHDGIVRPGIDEWREFIALRAAYANAVTAGGAELRRLAFPHAFSTGNAMATWLWNTRNEHALSHAISRWLLDEALAVGDAEAIDLGYRNCRLAIPTRLGSIVDDGVATSDADDGD